MEEALKFFTDFTSNPKENSRKATSFIILVLLFGFAYTYFGLLIKDNGITSSALLIVLFLLIKEAISDKDVLYSGNPDKNKYTKAFQEKLPTKYIIQTYGVEMSEAKTLWYNVFNKWKNEEHEMHSNWKKSLERGFKCRMVYFIIISFRFMFWISLVFTSIIFTFNHFDIKTNIGFIDNYFKNHSNYSGMITYILICFVVFIAFLIINYPSKNKSRGCFLRFNEMNELNINWLKRNIHSKEDFYA
jgi:uncharacterized membrane protein